MSQRAEPLPVLAVCHTEMVKIVLILKTVEIGLHILSSDCPLTMSSLFESNNVPEFVYLQSVVEKT